MIKFFCKIRQKMLGSNKISQYLIYAIGEIVLVVIGILIALQINTWNNELQNKARERNCIENLKTDLIIQQEIIQEQLENESLMLANIDTCSSFFNSAIPIDKLYKLLIDLASRRTFVSNKASFDNMVSTGDISLIRNLELQNAIVRYYKQLDYTESVVNNNNLFLIDSQFGNFVFSNELNLRLSKDGLVDPEYSSSPEKLFTLKSQLKGRQKASQSIHTICELQFEATEKLIRLIDGELEE